MIKQGSAAWHQQRLGKITGSLVHKLMSNGKKKGELSAGAITYCNELAADIVAGHPQEEGFSSSAMERGLELEPIAVDKFEDYMEDFNPSNPITVKEAGFAIHPHFPEFGASVDGLTSDGGILEIKCRGRLAHLQQFVIIDKLNKGESVTATELLKVAHHQRQWGMYCTGAAHSYFVAYTDDLPIDAGGLLVKRFERDEELIIEMGYKAVQARDLIPELVKRYKEAIENTK